MKRLLFLILVSSLVLSSCDSTGKKKKVITEHIQLSSAKLKRSSSATDSISYAIGVYEGADISRKIEQTNIADEIDYQLLLSGLQDGMNSEEDISSEEAIAIVNNYINSLFVKMKQDNEEEGIEFIGNKLKEPGIKITESGLLYEVIKEGTGRSPKSLDTVLVHYTGTLVDGTKFDSSDDHPGDEPAKFVPKNVVRGWQEGLQLMQEGARYKLYLPADLGYGKMAPGKIGPSATLIFDVELVKVIPQKVKAVVKATPKKAVKPKVAAKKKKK